MIPAPVRSCGGKFRFSRLTQLANGAKRPPAPRHKAGDREVYLPVKPHAATRPPSKPCDVKTKSQRAKPTEDKRHVDHPALRTAIADHAGRQDADAQARHRQPSRGPEHRMVAEQQACAGGDDDERNPSHDRRHIPNWSVHPICFGHSDGLGSVHIPVFEVYQRGREARLKKCSKAPHRASFGVRRASKITQKRLTAPHSVAKPEKFHCRGGESPVAACMNSVIHGVCAIKASRSFFSCFK